MHIFTKLINHFSRRGASALPQARLPQTSVPTGSEPSAEPVPAPVLEVPDRRVKPSSSDPGFGEIRIKRHSIRYERLEYFPDLPHKVVRCVGIPFNRGTQQFESQHRDRYPGTHKSGGQERRSNHQRRRAQARLSVEGPGCQICPDHCQDGGTTAGLSHGRVANHAKPAYPTLTPVSRFQAANA